MQLRLPPLAPLRQFEAAARQGSFKDAALELGLTASAVSHGIRTLEDWLGAPLFARERGGLMLTDAGAAFLPRVRDALEQIADAASGVAHLAGTSRLRISVAAGFGTLWLLPRLAGFSRENPDVAVDIDTSRRAVALPGAGIDVAIRMASAAPAAAWSELLVRERFVPVAHPDRAAGIREASQLDPDDLIHVTTVSEDWPAWAAAAGYPVPDPTRGARIDGIALAVDAAAQGLGIAIGRLPLVDDALSAGRLVPVLGPPVEMTTGYWLLCRHLPRDGDPVDRFRAWIRGEIGASTSR